MPEHRPATPETLRVLESFLWHDFDGGPADWTSWLHRKMPGITKSADLAFEPAMHLHNALRVLQAANNEVRSGNAAPGREAFHRLIDHYSIHPRLSDDGTLHFESHSHDDPVAHLVLMVLQAVRSGLWHRFKLCREPTCEASYYDASKACAKTWCAMETCGSRNKMRRYRART